MANEEADAGYTKRLSLVRQMLATERIEDLILAAISAGYSLEILSEQVAVSKWCRADYTMHYYRCRICSPETRIETLKQLLVDALWEVYK